MTIFKTVTFASVFALFAGASSAADLGATIGVDVVETVAGNFAATPTVELTFGNDLESAAFGGGTVASVDGTLVVDEWYIGVNLGATSVSLGDQGDLFSFGGLEAVGGETLASPADDHESIIVSAGAVSGLVGFSDMTGDISEIENVQLSYITSVAAVDLMGAVDYNLNSEDLTLAVDGTTSVTEQLSVSGTLTYADIFAYEGRVGYAVSTQVALAGYVNGDENDWAQNIGGGVGYLNNGLEAYAEVGYNLDSKEVTPAVGVSFSF